MTCPSTVFVTTSHSLLQTLTCDHPDYVDHCCPGFDNRDQHHCTCEDPNMSHAARRAENVNIVDDYFAQHLCDM